MKTWPNLELERVGFDFPALKLNATEGTALNRKDFNSYVCGITPYDATHLGHARTYLNFDLIHRYQLLAGKELHFTENVTDVDDPLLARASATNVDWKDLAHNQTELFVRDMTALRILPPATFLSVSETIDLVINGITILKDLGFVYEVEGDYYFDISSDLAKLPIPIEEALKIFAERGGDPDRIGKKHKLDPLLWRKKIEGEPSWSSPFGEGRPGWHIECGVIAIKGAADCNDEYLLDLQGGGSDLVFPHHFMTKIITEKIAGKKFAAELVHIGMLGLDGEKMSKSKGNLVFVHKLLDDGWDPIVIRYALINRKYSQESMWTANDLNLAKIAVDKIRTALAKIEVSETTPVINEMIKAISNDLDISKSLEILDSWCDKSIAGSTGGSVGAMSRFLDGALGLSI
ncbi:MAG: hypothetical protein RL129_2 [Actinomycetota bacterium]